MSWTDEKIENLKQLWDKGLTTMEIGKALGISKNAVVGKVHRLQLPPRPSPIRKAGEEKKIRPRKPIPTKTKASVKKETLNNTVPDAKKVSLMEVTATSCRWPIGDPKDGDFHFCDKEAVEGRPYCLLHCAQAYVGMNKFLKTLKPEE